MGKYYKFKEKYGEKHLIEETCLGEIDHGKLEKDPWDPFVQRVYKSWSAFSSSYYKLEDTSGGRREEFKVEKQSFLSSETGVLKRINGREYEYVPSTNQKKDEYGVCPSSKREKEKRHEAKESTGGATGGGLVSLLIFCFLLSSAMVGALLYLFLYPLKEEREKFLDFIISTAPAILVYIVLMPASFVVSPLVGYLIILPLMVLLAPLGISLIYLLFLTALPSSLLETWGFFPFDQWRIIFVGAGILVLVAWIIGIGKKNKILHISTYLLTGGFANFALLVESLSQLGGSSLEFLYDVSSFSPIFQLFTFSCWILGIFALLSLSLPSSQYNEKFHTQG